MNKRYWEIDFLRGIAIIMMIIFHLLWDLNYFFDFQILLRSGFWSFFQNMTASLFLFLVGISLNITNLKKNVPASKYIKRGFKIIFLGFIITVVTKIIFPNNFVIFGILHLIGFSIIFSYFLRKAKFWNFIFGIITILTGMYLDEITASFNWLLIFGIHSDNFYSVDYFPIFPWFGVVLMGLFFGDILYSKKGRKIKIRDISKNIIIKQICFIGKKSIIIYLIHQIILYGFFAVLVKIM